MRQLEVFESTVTNPSPDIDPTIRRHAAEELMAMDVPAATDVLAGALQSGAPAVELAVIEAMETAARPVKGLLEPAVSTLQVTIDENRERLSLILPRYGRPALDLVARRALDDKTAAERRIGPVYALASFRSRESAGFLMALLNSAAPPPPEVVLAACKSLERLTGLPYGSDAEQWRQWWLKLKDEPIEKWLQIVVTHLQARNGELERQITTEQREKREIANELSDSLRELFLHLTPDQQLERLPDLIDDDKVPIREFAIGRVDRMLRDSERVPDDIQARLASVLANTSEEPFLRLAAARLLNDLTYPGTTVMIIDALSAEHDQAIARGYFEILGKRPSPEAMNSMLSWLEDPTAGDAAATALWGLIANAGAQPDKETVRAVRAGYNARQTPSHARLLAAIGLTADRDRLEPLLDSQDSAVQRAVAEGFAWAGMRDPMLERVTDSDIYPYAVAVLVRGPADMASFTSLSQLAPPQEHADAWSAAVVALSSRLAPADLVAADDLLASQPHAPRKLRAEVLAPVAQLPSSALADDRRAELLMRLAELQLGLREYAQALQTTQRINGVPMSPQLAQLKFKAAVLARAYDEAASLSPAAHVWVETLDRLIEDHPASAAALAIEIDRRFDLEPQVQTLFEASVARLPTSLLTTAPAPPNDSPQCPGIRVPFSAAEKGTRIRARADVVLPFAEGADAIMS